MADLVLACIGEENGDVRQFATASYASDTSKKIEPSEAFACFVLEKDQPKSRYGTLWDIVWNRNRQRDKNEFETLRTIIASGCRAKSENDIVPPVFNYTPFYGWLPSGDALALAIAVLSLKKGGLPCGSLSIESGDRIGCSHGTNPFSSLIILQE
jgi:hypothetical protein